MYYSKDMENGLEATQTMNTPDTARGRLERMGFLLLLALLFAFGLFDRSLWSANDTTGGAMISEMYRSGKWVTPALNGQYHVETPPLMYWTSLLFCNLFGRVNEGLVRLPAALFGFGSVLIAFAWGCRMGREKAGLAAAFMCGTSILFLEHSKTVTVGTTITFMVMFALFIFWEAFTSTVDRIIKYVAFLIISALSFYAGGMIAPALIYLSVTSFLAYNRKWKLLITLCVLFAPLLFAVIFPWTCALWNTGGNDLLYSALKANQLGFILNFTGEIPGEISPLVKNNPGYYLTILPVAMLPWALLVPLAMLYWFRTERGLNTPLHLFLRLILVSMLVIVHVFERKTSAYALVFLPIIVLMTAVWSEDIMNDRNSRMGDFSIGISTVLIVLVLSIIPIIYILLLTLPQPLLDRYLHLNGVNIIRVTGAQSTYAGLAMSVISLSLTFLASRELWRKFTDGAFAATWLTVPIVASVLLILNAEIVIPPCDYQWTYKPFGRIVRHEKGKGSRVALAGDETQYIGAFTFYLKSNIRIIPSPDKLEKFLLGGDIPSGVIIKKSDLKKWLEILPECRFRVLIPDHNGYISNGFRLIVADRRQTTAPGTGQQPSK
ncbi:hypothetical protein C4588_01810 [Candidatus Parcubacteria bacterium]|nr:MAG: hypothetical protein C4588_01810 [Candidatus Parcubacteria bacterium]